MARQIETGEKLPAEWVAAGDFEKALAGYRKLKETNPNADAISEDELNAYGYQLTRKGKLKEALKIFRINTNLYPQAFDTYDSLGEAYLLMGETELGIKNYKKSLELNPKNTNATEALKKAAKSGK